MPRTGYFGEEDWESGGPFLKPKTFFPYTSVEPASLLSLLHFYLSLLHFHMSYIISKLPLREGRASNAWEPSQT
jgi:hypothetical protein